jgi:hypothetical protein
MIAAAEVVIRIDARDVPTVDVEGEGGEVFTYAVNRTEAAPPALAAFVVRRTDGGGDGPYRVTQGPTGSWVCPCKDAHYRPSRRGRCKHATICRKAKLFAESILSPGDVTMTAKRTADDQTPARTPDQPAEAAAPEGQAPPEEIARRLAEPFDASEVKFKPQTISGDRALMVPFVDARVVQDRLDDVLGVFGWEDRYQPQSDGSVLCLLTVHLGGRAVTKSDVGGQSEQPDEGDRCKAAVSDALKRAAVKFGVGRYLYRQKPQWVDWDAQKRQPKRQPVLPGAPPAQAQPKPAAPAQEKQAPPPGVEFHRKLVAYDGTLAGQGLCVVGELVKHVAAKGKAAGYPGDLTKWGEEQIAAARLETKDFEHKRRDAQLRRTA